MVAENIKEVKAVMKKSTFLFLAVLFLSLSVAPNVWAEAAEVAHKASGGGGTSFFMVVAISSAVAMALAAGVVAIGQSMAIKSALEGIARNPLAAGKILSALLLGLAMMEALAIYVLVIAFILLFANPFLAYF